MLFPVLRSVLCFLSSSSFLILYLFPQKKAAPKRSFFHDLLGQPPRDTYMLTQSLLLFFSHLQQLIRA
jgi:hypothetical protein